MLNTAKELNVSLKNSEEAKEFLALKKEIEKDEYLTALLKKIEEGKELSNNYLKNNEMDKYKAEKRNLEILKDEFMDYPLINNYLIAKNNLYNLLEQIVNILSE